VSAIRVIYTKSGEFYYRYLHRFSIISPITGISELSFVTACSNSYTKSILTTYKSSYKQVLYFGLPSVIGYRVPNPFGFGRINDLTVLNVLNSELDK
jgi:hypothetical protein